MYVTTLGRPLGKFPLFKWRDGQGGYLLTLQRVDVSDAGKPRAEAFYQPLFKRDDRDGMETWEFYWFDHQLILFFSKKGIRTHVANRNQRPEE